MINVFSNNNLFPCIICAEPTSNQGEEYRDKMCPDCQEKYDLAWSNKDQVDNIVSQYQRGLLTPLDVIQKCGQLVQV